MVNRNNNEAIAFLKAVKSSPLKVIRLTNNLVGSDVEEVLAQLKFCNLKLAPIVRSLIYSAMSNAENNHNMDIDNLYIKRFKSKRSFKKV